MIVKSRGLRELGRHPPQLVLRLLRLGDVQIRADATDRLAIGAAALVHRPPADADPPHPPVDVEDPLLDLELARAGWVQPGLDRAEHALFVFRVEVLLDFGEGEWRVGRPAASGLRARLRPTTQGDALGCRIPPP